MPPAIEAQRPHSATAQPLSAEMRASLDEARAADPRPEVIALWDEIERLADAADDPVAALSACCELLIAEADKARAEHREEIDRIAADLGAVIVEVDPANKPASLAGVTVHGGYIADPEPRLIFPAGQPLYERLETARKIAADLAVTA